MDNLIEKFALENAVRFKGKANPDAVIGSCIREKPALKKDMKSLGKKVNDITKKVNSMKLEDQKKRLQELAPELLEKKKGTKKGLFDSFKVEGAVVTAFPPEPSKYPHIGHAKALFVNYEFAKLHNGKFILRFEDTNPELATEEFHKIILENVKWLGVKIDQMVHASDYMDDFYRLAEKLIRIGKAYICSCKQDDIRANRMKGKACDCRYLHIKEYLIGWNKMCSGFEGLILRLKIDVKHKNSAMRDPTMFRVINKPHARTGNKYKAWPTYDFENAVMDGLQGVTHRFRTKEFELRNELQRYLQRLLSFSETSIFEFARFNLEGVESSGRVIRELIKKKKLTGWDDPSLTTIVALKRRGFAPEAIKSFVLSTGITKSEATLTWDDLIVHNKRFLDADSNRYFFIKNPVRVRIQDAPSMNIGLNLHPDFHERGVRKFKTKDLFWLADDDFKRLEQKKLYRLMDCLNFTRKNGYFIFKSENVDDYKKKGEFIMHWLPVNGSIKVDVLMPDKSVVSGLAEPMVDRLQIDDVIQFERFGFCRLDQRLKTKLVFRFTHK